MTQSPICVDIIYESYLFETNKVNSEKHCVFILI